MIGKSVGRLSVSHFFGRLTGYRPVKPVNRFNRYILIGGNPANKICNRGQLSLGHQMSEASPIVLPETTKKKKGESSKVHLWLENMMNGDNIVIGKKCNHPSKGRCEKVWMYTKESTSVDTGNSYNTRRELSRENIKILLNRRVVRNEKGFSFPHDLACYRPNAIQFKDEDVNEFMRRIECPVLLLYHHKNSFIYPLEKKAAEVKDIQVVGLKEGGHHLHMENAEESAIVVKQFLSHEKTVRSSL